MGRPKLTTEDFIARAKLVHGDRYSYEHTIYIGGLCNLQVTCRKHGVFTKQAANLLQGGNCPACAQSLSDLKKTMSTEDFIKAARLIHGETYIYRNTRYFGANANLVITCKTHGHFIQRASSHLEGRGCLKCHTDSISVNQDMFIEKSVKIHGDTYDYSKVVYESYYKKVVIICKIHGEFLQNPAGHLIGAGCQACANYGFDYKLPATLYLLDIGEKYLGYGITRDFSVRLSKHQHNLSKGGVSGESYQNI